MIKLTTDCRAFVLTLNLIRDQRLSSLPFESSDLNISAIVGGRYLSKSELARVERTGAGGIFEISQGKNEIADLNLRPLENPHQLAFVSNSPDISNTSHDMLKFQPSTI